MHAPDAAPSSFDLVILGASGVSVAVVLAAVARNFARGRPAEEAERRIRSPIATVSMLAFLVLMLAPLSLRLGAVELPPLPRRASMLLGVTLMASGAFVNVAGRRILGANWADQVTVYRDQTLVQGGVFGLVRHPLYASTIWMFLGGALVFRNVLMLLATLAVFVPAMFIRASQEERMLRSRFPEYADYQARVGMLFPRLIPSRRRS